MLLGSLRCQSALSRDAVAQLLTSDWSGSLSWSALRLNYFSCKLLALSCLVGNLVHRGVSDSHSKRHFITWRDISCINNGTDLPTFALVADVVDRIVIEFDRVSVGRLSASDFGE